MQKSKQKQRHSIFYVSLFIGKLKRRIKKSKHRRFVLEEWYTTEVSFSKQLQNALNFIKKPLLQQKLIDKQGSDVLFPEFQGMLELSKVMIQTVSVIRNQKNPNLILIGEQLIHFATFYKLYGTYFGNRLRCQRLLNKITEQSKPTIQTIEEKLRVQMKKIDERKGNITIVDLLQQPQYRMFKYVLLLKDYIKKLPKDHRDYCFLIKALQKFEEINLSNNQLMGRLEAQQKKVKLDRLFGKTIGNSSDFLVEMSADSLYFPVKLYIFNNLVIVASISSTLGMQEERRYINIYLNEASFIHPKPDVKYFKNSLLLCGQNDALHCFLPDPGTRQEILITIGKVIRQLQIKSITRRQQRPAIGETSAGKISFAIQINSKVQLASELQIQILKVQVRPLTTFTNDTVFLTRFMGPISIEDYDAVGSSNNHDLSEATWKKGIWQLVEIHLSQVVDLVKQLGNEYPGIKFPQIDPLTKQMNAFTEGKKNTKMFEVRGYLLEEFFNFLFRHPAIISSPLWLVRKYKLSSSFFQYLCQKNEYLSCRKEQSRQQMSYYRYGTKHCKLCSEIIKASLTDIETIRTNFIDQKRKDYCFNAFNLARLRTCSLETTNVKNLEHLLLRELYESGRIDYALLPIEELHQKYQQIKIYINDIKCLLVHADYRKKIGEVLLDLGHQLGLRNILDYRLILKYEGKERILDQDELIFDIILKYSLQATEKEASDRESRFSLNQTSIQPEQSFFSFFKNMIPFSSKPSSQINLKKIIYLPKEIQLLSFDKFNNKALLVIQELYCRLLQGQLIFEQPQDLAEISGLWFIMNYYDKPEISNASMALSIVAEKILPMDQRDIIHNKMFTRVYLDTCFEFTKKIFKKLSVKDIPSLLKRSFRVFYRTINTYTYNVPVTPRIIPLSLIIDGKGPITSDCFLGVNYRQLVVFREKNSGKASIKLPLEDIRVTHTTFTIFIEYSYFNSSPQNSTLQSAQLQKSNLRFDSRMLFQFQSLLSIYENLKRVFPQIMA